MTTQFQAQREAAFLHTFTGEATQPIITLKEDAPGYYVTVDYTTSVRVQGVSPVYNTLREAYDKVELLKQTYPNSAFDCLVHIPASEGSEFLKWSLKVWGSR